MIDDTDYKIVKLIPVTDIYIREPGDPETYFYDRAVALALIEFNIERIGLCQALHYLCRCDIEDLQLGELQRVQDIFFKDELPDGAVTR